MAYSRLNLKDGQKWKAEHVSHIEDGIVGVETELNTKQPKGEYLTEHQKIKTLNGKSMVGEGNVDVEQYVHPDTHPATMIMEDSEHRFTNDSEKASWNSKAEGTHGHSMSDVEGLQTALDGKSDTSHTHDDRYYTEAEVDEALAGKAEKVHGHVVSDVDNLQSALDGKSDTDHKHDGVYAPLVHTHVSADITDLESFVDERIGVVAGSALDEINGEVV